MNRSFPSRFQAAATGWLLSLLTALTCPALGAELQTFTVDPTRSSVSLTGNASGANLEVQGPGSLTTTFEGSIALEVGANEVRFPGGSRIFAQEPNSWQPGPNGADGSAPASYGGRATIGSGIFSTTAIAATRRINFDMLSLPLVFQNGSFNAEGLQFQFVETNNPSLDYRTSGLLSIRDSLALSGLATNKLAGASTIVTQGDTETLTIQVSATYFFELFAPDDSYLTLTGQLVATRSLSPTQPTIVIEPVAPGANSMTLTWPSGYKLQKASALSASGWDDTGRSSPANVPFTLAAEFFQIVPQIAGQ